MLDFLAVERSNLKKAADDATFSNIISSSLINDLYGAFRLNLFLKELMHLMKDSTVTRQQNKSNN